ncbi:tripartite tricarboxylate transporter permease [Falsirhodobacter halotolerans]|nr:tripartite tricarboxylate transporter permease [Falsirhodobacter halotolerans]
MIGPHEFFSLVLVALVLIASMSEGSTVKALIGAALGMLLALPGLDPVTGQLRLDFGLPGMVGGFNMMAVLAGIFAVSQLLLDAGTRGPAERIRLQAKRAALPLRDFFRHWGNLLRSSVIGTAIGILPGIGGSVGSIVSYTTARNLSKHPEKFGTGIDDGVIASETANNATIGGALIPMITMGIPGSIIDVILIAALTLHDLRPGPLLFQSNPEIVYGFMSAMFIANVIMLLLMLASIRWLARIVDVPKAYLVPILLLFCVLGTFALNNRMFDVGVMFAFGLVGILLRGLRIPIAPVVIGFILTPIAEKSLRAALIAEQGDWTTFLTRPISAVMLAIALLMLILPFWQMWKRAFATR